MGRIGLEGLTAELGMMETMGGESNEGKQTECVAGAQIGPICGTKETKETEKKGPLGSLRAKPWAVSFDHRALNDRELGEKPNIYYRPKWLAAAGIRV